jgi:hypothetical protein
MRIRFAVAFVLSAFSAAAQDSGWITSSADTTSTERKVMIGTNITPNHQLTVKSIFAIPQFRARREGADGVLSMFVSDANSSTIAFDSEFVSGWIARHETSAFISKWQDRLFIQGSAANTRHQPAGSIHSIAEFDLATRLVTFRGDVTVDGNISARYEDVAEWVPVSEPMEAGTVVVLNVSKVNEVMPSSEPYDTRIAGVVSPQPGLVLGVEAPNKAKIATTGRVRVRVDATRRPIRIGDLLVTSGSRGRAMVSEPVELSGRKFHQPGTVIGKALEPLPGGEGEILVLLSLQ